MGYFTVHNISRSRWRHQRKLVRLRQTLARFSLLRDKALGMSTMPRPGCSNDRFQIILCLPSKFSLGLAAICQDYSRISWTPGSELDRELDPTDTPGRLNYF